MRIPPNKRIREEGFTLVEILVALALVTTLSLMMFQSVAPWLNLRQRIDTERRLDEVHEALETAYRANAMRIEGGAQELRLDTGTITPSVLTGRAGNRRCSENTSAMAALGPYLSWDPNRSLLDGSGAPMCVFISRRLTEARDGVNLTYHVVAVVALGQDGVLDDTTALDVNTGTLTVGGDDLATVVNGFSIQYELYQETRRRVDRVADIYGSYFTARYLGNPHRDYSIDYFVAGPYPYDQDATSGPVGTNGGWYPAGVALASLGLGPSEQHTPYESNNTIEVANQRLDAANLAPLGVQVQEPATKPGGLALPPYTALVRARIPGGGYVLRVVPGNY